MAPHQVRHAVRELLVGHGLSLLVAPILRGASLPKSVSSTRRSGARVSVVVCLVAWARLRSFALGRRRLSSFRSLRSFPAFRSLSRPG